MKRVRLRRIQEETIGHMKVLRYNIQGTFVQTRFTLH